MARKRVVASGRVQGVFFRDSTREEAERAGLAGWVWNLPDGRVEAVFEGDSEVVDRLVTWAGEGPESANVRDIEVYEEEPEGLTGFTVR